MYEIHFKVLNLCRARRLSEKLSFDIKTQTIITVKQFIVYQLI